MGIEGQASARDARTLYATGQHSKSLKTSFVGPPKGFYKQTGLGRTGGRDGEAATGCITGAGRPKEGICDPRDPNQFSGSWTVWDPVPLYTMSLTRTSSIGDRGGAAQGQGKQGRPGPGQRRAELFSTESSRPIDCTSKTSNQTWNLESHLFLSTVPDTDYRQRIKSVSKRNDLLT